MARPKKIGLEYFPLDCQMDDKVEMLEAEHGLEGFAVYIKLLQAIYQTESGELDMSIIFRWKTLGKQYGIPAENLRKIVDTMLEVALFDRQAFAERQVLTSSGIQKRLGKVAGLREKDRFRKTDGDSELSDGFPLENATKGKGKDTIVSQKEKEKEKETSSLRSEAPAVAAAPASEKKIEASPSSESQRPASRTRGAARPAPEALPEGSPLADLLNPGGDAARVQELPQPLTPAQAEALLADYPEAVVRDIFCQMANWAKLLTPSGATSANLTARNWLAKRAKDALTSHSAAHATTTPAGYPLRPTNGHKPHGDGGSLARLLAECD
ncbi:MAG: DUF4373 domain-containing protein [Janthinobacterium lividum]